MQTKNVNLRPIVEAVAARVAALGNWPPYINAVQSLVSRIPVGDALAPGFDAGLACALDLIPRDRQKLAATLHAAYSCEAVQQVRKEAIDMDSDSETCWWLAACNVCQEGAIDEASFHAQVESFVGLVNNAEARQDAARRELKLMSEKFKLVDGIPFVIRDGGLQGAYVAGYNWGVQYIESYGIFFIGTILPTLGLESFAFSDRKDEKGRPVSGPVHGSKQFVKVSSLDELAAATKLVRETLGPPMAGNCPKCCVQLLQPWACDSCGIAF